MSSSEGANSLRCIETDATRTALRVAKSSKAELEKAPDFPNHRGFCCATQFWDSVDSQLAHKRGTLALIEIQESRCAQTALGETAEQYTSLSQMIGLVSSFLRRGETFSIEDRRFIVFLNGVGRAHQRLQQLSRLLANSSRNALAEEKPPLHPTPAIGYVQLHMAVTSIELRQMAETALSCAKSSLDIQPFRFVPHSLSEVHRAPLVNPFRLWGRVPQWIALSIQFLISSLLGLGAPFFLYATFDALGFDISGPVYIGVVVVLVVTAAMIWIECLLSLSATVAPGSNGKPYPAATIIIPAYLPNEAATIIETINAFMRIDYPHLVQIIVAYNCPTNMAVEDELTVLAASPDKPPNFILEPIRVVGSTSKAQNVNAVVGMVRGQFVGIFDADHHPRFDSLQRAWRWLSNGWDIVQGRCSIRNGAESWVSRMVAIEFEQIYSISHPGRARLHGFGIFGGSNGFWRTEVLHEIRMRHSMLTEDIDSSIRAVNEGYKIASDRCLISEELAPTTLNQLLNQRLRWAQGWFQVSLRRIIPSLISPRVSLRQKLGLIHLLVWRELFPWYSIQVLPILIYWVWAYGWRYIHWAVPIFVATTIFTFSTGPLQVLLAYVLAEKPRRHKTTWFLHYFFVSTLFYSPFKDTISRIAHIKEAMRERAWRVTPRAAEPKSPRTPKAPAMAALVVAVILLTTERSNAQTDSHRPGFSAQYLATLLGGEVSTINAARQAYAEGRSAEAAKLYEQAITAVPVRRGELLSQYADALVYSNQAAKSVPLYRELLNSHPIDKDERFHLSYQLALALTWSSQYPAALKEYDELLRGAPGNADVIIHRARVLSWLGRSDESINALYDVAPVKWAGGTLGSLGDEILVAAARKAAVTNQNEKSRDLFARAIEHNGKLRRALIREFADQLLFTNRPDSSIPLYREVIGANDSSVADKSEANLRLGQALLQTSQPKEANKSFATVVALSSPGTDTYKSAQRGLSLSLTWSGAPAKAAKAWQNYLKEAPKDTDALIHQAQVLSTLHETAQALREYKAALAVDPNSRAASAGIEGETIDEARADARDNRNSEAAKLFASAVALDHHRRPEILREYADQLSFSDHASEAVPLYLEVLGGGGLSAFDRKRALKGLADAYSWSGHPDLALAAYRQLVETYPDDESLQWAELVLSARQAAQASKNRDSADLFARAIGISSVSSATILREYADQLSFSGQSEKATAIYSQYLAQRGLADADRLTAEVGLAQAFDWSGHQDNAKAIYTELSERYPANDTYKWDILVVSAHQAARSDQNHAAAVYFASAIRLLPNRRGTLLREYADQLSFSGQAARAIPFYEEVLGQEGLSEPARVSAVKGLAQAFDWNDRPDKAKAIYNDLKREYSDVSIQWGILVTSAHIAAKDDQNKEAAIFLARAIQLIPARRMIVLKDYADKLTFSGGADQAIPLYRELLAHVQKPTDITVYRLALAFALASGKDYPAALEEYQTVLKAAPDSISSRNGMAQTLAWMGRQTDAEGTYQEVLALDPKNAIAQRGLAQVEDWLGHHRVAQALLNERIAKDPRDLDARRLLAQSLVWSGRPDLASAELQLALGSAKNTFVKEAGSGPANSK